MGFSMYKAMTHMSWPYFKEHLDAPWNKPTTTCGIPADILRLGIMPHNRGVDSA